MRVKIDTKTVLIVVLSLVVLLGVSAGLLAGRAASNKRYHEISGDGWVAYVRKSNKVYVELDANATTGFQWMVDEVPSFLELTGNDYRQSKSSKGLVGAGGTTTISFKALDEGTGVVELAYRRDWVGGETARVLELTCNVERNSNGSLVARSLEIAEKK